MKKTYAAIIAIAAVATFVALYVRGTATIPPNVKVFESKPEQWEESKSAAAFHPVSLPALMEKEYDGRDFTIGKVLERHNGYTRYFVTYKSGQLTISGIMNVPSGQGPFPILLLNHGYIDPAVYTNGRGLRREQDYLARQGFVVVHSDYRNHAQSDKDPDAETTLRLGYVEDVLNAVYALKKSGLSYLDTERIGMLGHSMGGGVTINTLVTKPGLLKAAVLYAPVSANFEDNFRRWLMNRPEVAEKVLKLYGSPEASPEFWKNVSAVNFLSRLTEPVLIFHGTRDESVPYEWSVTLEKRLTEQYKEARLVTFEGEAHEFGPQWTGFMLASAEFFKEKLGVQK